MKISHQRTLAGVLGLGSLLWLSVTAQATQIDISQTNNIAPLRATLTASSNGGSADRVVDDILEDKTGYTDSYCWYSGGENPSSLTLTFSNAYELTELRAWISSDTPAGIDTYLDRETTLVLFEVSSDGGTNWTTAGSVTNTSFIVAPEDPTAIWSLAELSGAWSSVNAIRFSFTHVGSSRVGEIHAISGAAPATIPTLSEWGMIVMAGGMGWLMYRRVHRRKLVEQCA